MTVKSICLITIISSCSVNSTDTFRLNPNIVELKHCCSREYTENYIMGVMVSDIEIYALNRTLVKFDVSNNFDDLTQNSVDILPRASGKPNSFLHANEDKNKFLIIRSKYSDVSLGELVEIDLESKSYQILRDSSYNISSAVYFHGRDNKLVYYTFGNDDGLKPGYYLYDKISNTDSLLLE